MIFSSLLSFRRTCCIYKIFDSSLFSKMSNNIHCLHTPDHLQFVIAFVLLGMVIFISQSPSYRITAVVLIETEKVVHKELFCDLLFSTVLEYSLKISGMFSI